MPPKKFRTIHFSKKLASHGFKPARSGYHYEKLPGVELYRQVSDSKGKTLKEKGHTKLFGTFGDQKSSVKHWEEKYPQFNVFVEGRESAPIDSSRSLKRKAEKAQKSGKAKRSYPQHQVLAKGSEFQEPTHAPVVIARHYEYKEKGKVVRISNPDKVPTTKKIRFVYQLDDGTTQKSPSYEKRLPLEVRHFKAAVEKGRGSAYRPGISGKLTPPVLQQTIQMGPGTDITSTRALVAKVLGGRQPKGNLKLAFDWKVFEGVGSARELKGKSGGGFKFNAPKASKAFMAMYRKIVKEKMVDALVHRSPRLAKLPYDRIIKASRLGRKTLARMKRELVKAGAIPVSALGLFFETKILEVAKLRGVIISAGKAFKDHKGKGKFKKAGLRSAVDEGWQSTFNFNLYREK